MVQLSRMGSLFFVLLVLLAQTAEAGTYTIQQGDSLGALSKTFFPEKPVWGPRGGVAHLVMLNAKTISNPNLIYVGKTLRIDDAVHAPAPLAQKNVHRTIASQAEKTVSQEASVPLPAETLPHKESEKSIAHAVGAYFELGMTSLQARDKGSTTKASLESERDIRIGASWTQEWTESFYTYQAAELRLLKLSESTNSNRPLADKSLSTTKLFLGTGYNMHRYLKPFAQISYGGEFFVRGFSASIVGIDALQILTPSVGTVSDLYTQDDTRVLGKVIVGFPMSANSDGYSVMTGHQYQLSLGLKKSFIHSHLGLDFGYRERVQDTSLVDFKETSVFGHLYYVWPLSKASGEKP